MEIKNFFFHLQRLGPSYGYHPDPEQSILITPATNVHRAHTCFRRLGFEIVQGHRYLGGFVGEDDDMYEWVDNKASQWAAAIHSISQACPKFPQSAYCILQKSL